MPTVQGLRLEPCGFVGRITPDGAPAQGAERGEQRAASATLAKERASQRARATQQRSAASCRCLRH